MMSRQGLLFPKKLVDEDSLQLDGFRYLPEFIDRQAESRLVLEIERLDLKPFEFHGHLGNRRVISFGLRYDYSRREVQAAGQPPVFLQDLRRRAAEFAKRSTDDLRQAGVNEYKPGAGIGWHRDKPQFGDVVGVSLVSPAHLRFRKWHGEKWVRRTIAVEPRSIYILSGAARSQWEHSVPPVDKLRYSIMFRTLAAKEVANAGSDRGKVAEQ